VTNNGLFCFTLLIDIYLTFKADLANIQVYDHDDLRDAVTRSSICAESLGLLRVQLNIWKGRLAVYRPQLNSHDLCEFFMYLNDPVKYDRVAQERRQEVRNGTRFMFRPNGQVMSTREASIYLDQYRSDRLLQPHVRTLSSLEYNGFDEYGELVVGHDRRQIHTMLLAEMWDYCRQTGNVIPMNHRPPSQALTNQEAAAAIVHNAYPDHGFDLEY
jgi:hypothetical protein